MTDRYAPTPAAPRSAAAQPARHETASCTRIRRHFRFIGQHLPFQIVQRQRCAVVGFGRAGFRIRDRRLIGRRFGLLAAEKAEHCSGF